MTVFNMSVAGNLTAITQLMKGGVVIGRPVDEWNTEMSSDRRLDRFSRFCTAHERDRQR